MRTEPHLTTGELFFGYGGLGMAVNKVFNSHTVWLSDIDSGPNKIAAHRYPDVPNLGDVSAIDWGQVEPVDIICGGSPCQDLSTAGRRAGMTDGTRSNLWVMMREAVAQIRPRYVIWENVRGAYSATAASAMESDQGLLGDHPTGVPALRALGRVLGDLADLGYDARWCGLRAADVGAPHGRFRVFLLATPADAGGIGGHEAVEHDGGGSEEGDRRSVPDERDRDPLRAGSNRGLTLLPTPGANLGDNGGPQHPDKRRAGGHSVSIEDVVHGLTLLPTPRATDGTKGGPNQRGSSGDLMLPSAVAKLLPTPKASNNETRQSESHGGRYGSFHGLLTGQVDWREYAPAIARWEQVFGRPCPPPTILGRTGKPKLNPQLTEWMMGVPEGWITNVPGITPNEALKACGNGVVPQQAAAALRHMLRRIHDEA